MCFEDGNRNCVLWIMGPTASGKTTLASGLKTKFRQNGILTLPMTMAKVVMSSTGMATRAIVVVRLLESLELAVP